MCRLIKIELYKIFTIINRAIKGLHCTSILIPVQVLEESLDKSMFSTTSLKYVFIDHKMHKIPVIFSDLSVL